MTEEFITESKLSDWVNHTIQRNTAQLQEIETVLVDASKALAAIGGNDDLAKQLQDAADALAKILSV